ncbi:MAG: hypothetical protein ACRCS3_15405, partial [Paracoccaceae bacterium]
SANTAIAVDASAATINNAGRISSDAGNGIAVTGGVTLNNTGEILAGDSAVAVASIATASSIMNSGVIRAGFGFGVFGTVFLGNAVTTIVNSGTIEYLGVEGDAIRIDSDFGTAGTIRIENHGTIRSLNGIGITAFENDRDGMFITNTGLITGLTGAIVGSQAGDNIINSGTLAVQTAGSTGVNLGGGSDILRNHGVIETRVNMGTGADFFDARLSDQGNYVLGGAGEDGLIGGAFDDSLYGGADNDRVFGGAGDDELFESGGQDTIFGGSGDDEIGVFDVLAGALFGGQGDDSIDGSTAGDTLHGGAGNDTLTGGGGNDVYTVDTLLDEVIEAAASGVADVVQSGVISLDLNLYDQVENATLTGGAALRLTGSAVANVLTGNAAANTITGDAGNDTILGGVGADVITGGVGRDSMTGGAGADVFVLLSAAETGLTGGTRDSITDFTVGVDDLRMIFMGSYIGAANFTAAGQVRYDTATGVLSGSTDADVAAEWQVQMATGLALTAGDFVF